MNINIIINNKQIMIKNIAKFIATDFMENTIDKNKDSNIYANLANNTLSVFDIIANFSRYIIIGLVVFSLFNIITPMGVYILFSSILLSVFGFMLSNIISFIVIIKLVIATKNEVSTQILKTINLAKDMKFKKKK